jgi:hypothetical protein
LSDRQKSTLTKEQTDYLNMCKSLANGVPSTESSLLVKITQFIRNLEEDYKNKTIYFMIDISKRASDFSHTTKTGPGEVTCKCSALKISQSEAVHFNPSIPELGTVKSFCVHKKFETLIYALFYVVRFQDCVVQKIKKVPGASDSEFKKYFTYLENSMQYIAYHLPRC